MGNTRTLLMQNNWTEREKVVIFKHVVYIALKDHNSVSGTSVGH